jgi:hypothetical protein
MSVPRSGELHEVHSVGFVHAIAANHSENKMQRTKSDHISTLEQQGIDERRSSRLSKRGPTQCKPLPAGQRAKHTAQRTCGQEIGLILLLDFHITTICDL